MNGDIPGLQGRERALTAAVVRYHNRKADPANHHIAYAALNNNDRRLARRLASLVRIATRSASFSPELFGRRT
jgi:exopolyphosphatase/pppGpp-phosphohydrolase